jgi:hypothetical protein
MAAVPVPEPCGARKTKINTKEFMGLPPGRLFVCPSSRPKASIALAISGQIVMLAWSVDLVGPKKLPRRPHLSALDITDVDHRIGEAAATDPFVLDGS